MFKATSTAIAIQHWLSNPNPISSFRFSQIIVIPYLNRLQQHFQFPLNDAVQLISIISFRGLEMCTAAVCTCVANKPARKECSGGHRLHSIELYRLFRHRFSNIHSLRPYKDNEAQKTQPPSPLQEQVYTLLLSLFRLRLTLSFDCYYYYQIHMPINQAWIGFRSIVYSLPFVAATSISIYQKFHLELRHGASCRLRINQLKFHSIASTF